jgi:hypothetical protein
MSKRVGPISARQVCSTESSSAALPAGLGLPAVHRVADLPDDRIVMVLEDIVVGAVRWDTQRFATAAELLGRASARLTRSDAQPVQFRTPAGPLVTFYETYLVPLVLPALQIDALWKHADVNGG